MKNNLIYSPEAFNDLNEIWDYIAFEFGSLSDAERVVNKIIDTADKLEDFPEIGPALTSITGIESDYHFLVSGKYMIFYRICGRDVFVDRILHSRRNYLRILFSKL